MRTLPPNLLPKRENYLDKFTDIQTGIWPVHQIVLYELGYDFLNLNKANNLGQLLQGNKQKRWTTTKKSCKANLKKKKKKRKYYQLLR